MEFFFGILLDLHYLWLRRRYSRSKKLKYYFGFLLANSYLCNMRTKNLYINIGLNIIGTVLLIYRKNRPSDILIPNIRRFNLDLAALTAFTTTNCIGYGPF